ncbi:MAG: hypothetical protein HQL05_06705 [Nitrospirae bacterium]|uniref:hypothetical protein n=1 Tax=Candidatus Magnetobacterium casense TaxID=1455061 RepID=UPI00059038DC|nr:hypothetical protein [Candidatus Magnetobacterium casensis]MBF0337508.1 hypothetical protein [Nitrospirota bacterium]
MDTKLAESLKELGDTLQHVENLVSSAKHAVRQAQAKVSISLQTETTEQYCNLVDWTQLLACEMIQVIELGIQETMAKCREVKELLPDDDSDMLRM